MRPAACLAVILLAASCRQPPVELTPQNPAVADGVRLEGFEVLRPKVREQFGRDLPIEPGEVLSEKDEQAAGEQAVQVLQNAGFPYAQVGLEREPAGAGRIAVVLRAQPGPRGYFGSIDIAGNRRVDGRIIRRRVAYAPGDPFSRTAIERTQQQIGAIGLFKSIEIRVDDSPVPAGAQAVDVPTVITVQERSPWQWNLGLGYAAGDKLGVDARLSHLNAFGSARRIDLEGRVSAIERRAELTFTQADSWHPSLTLAMQGRHQEIDETAFFVSSRGGQAAVSWQWTPSLSTTASYAASLERSDVASSLEALTGLEDGMRSAWSLDLDHRRVSAGSSVRTISLHVEQAGGWMPGTFNYASAAADIRHYQPVGAAGIVAASRLRLGTVVPFSNEADVPLLKRFFLGGSSDMRGWGFYELSPLSRSGEPVGGKSALVAQIEARAPIAPRVRGVIFAEAGNVWQAAWTLRPGRLLYDAGAGIRVETPFGTVRLDAAYQLKTLDGLRIDGDPQRSRWRFHVGLGEAY